MNNNGINNNGISEQLKRLEEENQQLREENRLLKLQLQELRDKFFKKNTHKPDEPVAFMFCAFFRSFSPSERKYRLRSDISRTELGWRVIHPTHAGSFFKLVVIST